MIPRKYLCVLSFWAKPGTREFKAGKELEIRFSSILDYVLNQNPESKTASVKVRTIRYLGRLVRLGILEKRVKPDRSTQYRLTGKGSKELRDLLMQEQSERESRFLKDAEFLAERLTIASSNQTVKQYQSLLGTFGTVEKIWNKTRPSIATELYEIEKINEAIKSGDLPETALNWTIEKAFSKGLHRST